MIVRWLCRIGMHRPAFRAGDYHCRYCKVPLTI